MAATIGLQTVVARSWGPLMAVKTGPGPFVAAKGGCSALASFPGHFLRGRIKRPGIICSRFPGKVGN